MEEVQVVVVQVAEAQAVEVVAVAVAVQVVEVEVHLLVLVQVEVVVFEVLQHLQFPDLVLEVQQVELQLIPILNRDLVLKVLPKEVQHRILL